MTDSTANVPLSRLYYDIDKHNLIIHIGGDWENAANMADVQQELNPDKVIGRLVFDFICSDSTRMYYDAVFKLCRLKQSQATLDYRCDSPTHKRFMQLTLFPLKDFGIRLQHDLVREEPFDHTLDVKENLDYTPSQQVIITPNKRCSICNRLQLAGETVWVYPEELVEKQPLSLKVIHTICSECKNINWKKDRRQNSVFNFKTK